MTDNVTTCTVGAAGLAAAVAAVRFAAGSDPEMPMLGGVLIELGDNLVRLVATDRFRLAVSAAPAERTVGAAVRAIAPTSFVDALSPLLAAATTATSRSTAHASRCVLRVARRSPADALPYGLPRLPPAAPPRSHAPGAGRRAPAARRPGRRRCRGGGGARGGRRRHG
jgi:hypothetical protein